MDGGQRHCERQHHMRNVEGRLICAGRTRRAAPGLKRSSVIGGCLPVYGAGRQARTPLPGAFPATKAAKARPHAELSQAGTALGQNGMRDAPPGLKVVAMKYASSQIVYAYWDRLRGDRPRPSAARIEPGEIREALADAFVLK